MDKADDDFPERVYNEVRKLNTLKIKYTVENNKMIELDK